MTTMDTQNGEHMRKKRQHKVYCPKHAARRLQRQAKKFEERLLEALPKSRLDALSAFSGSPTGATSDAIFRGLEVVEAPDQARLPVVEPTCIPELPKEDAAQDLPRLDGVLEVGLSLLSERPSGGLGQSLEDITLVTPRSQGAANTTLQLLPNVLAGVEAATAILFAGLFHLNRTSIGATLAGSMADSSNLLPVSEDTAEATYILVTLAGTGLFLLVSLWINQQRQEVKPQRKEVIVRL
jgi:hypothetical protein